MTPHVSLVMHVYAHADWMKYALLSVRIYPSDSRKNATGMRIILKNNEKRAAYLLVQRRNPRRTFSCSPCQHTTQRSEELTFTLDAVICRIAYTAYPLYRKRCATGRRTRVRDVVMDMEATVPTNIEAVYHACDCYERRSALAAAPGWQEMVRDKIMVFRAPPASGSFLRL